jgi:hypothetical protein
MKYFSLAICILFVHLAGAQDIEQVIKAKPFTWTGSVGAGTEFYTTNAAMDRYSPFTWQTNGNFTMTLFEAFSLPFSFTLGKQIKEYSVPFFQMGLSPSYKWATLHGGYRNMVFNPYTLNGQTFLGVGVELNPSLFRFGAMYGRLAKATTFNPSESVPDLPAYKRFGYGFKAGVGTENNFVDFSYFSSKDDTTSIDRPDDEFNIRPEDNMLFGVSTRQVIWENLSIEADYGVSFLTADLQGPEGEEKTPLKGNATTTTTHAVKTSINYAFKSANLGFSYERVDPGYRSHGAYYFSDDFEQVLFTPSWSMLQNKMMVNISAGVQRNNLKSTNDVRDFQIANSVGLSVNPSQSFGFDVNYSNFSMNQKATGAINLTDSNKIINVTHNLNFSPRTMFTDDKKVQSIVGNYNLQLFNDKNLENADMADNNSHFASVNYNVSFIPTAWNVFTGFNAVFFDQQTTNLKQFGVSAGFSKAFVDNTLSTSLNSTYNVSYLNSAYDGGVYNLGINLGYTLVKKHLFSVNASLLNNQSKLNESFTEFRGGVRYNFTIR